MIDVAGFSVASHWFWLTLALLLGIAEILVPGVFLLWIAIAAALTGGAVMIIGITLPTQIMLFAVLSLIATYAGRRWYAANPVASQDPLLNDRAARLIGETVIVVEAIRGGQGRVKVADGAWPCRGPDTATGASVRVIGTDGMALVVETVE